MGAAPRLSLACSPDRSDPHDMGSELFPSSAAGQGAFVALATLALPDPVLLPPAAAPVPLAAVPVPAVPVPAPPLLSPLFFLILSLLLSTTSSRISGGDICTMFARVVSRLTLGGILLCVTRYRLVESVPNASTSS